MPANSRVFLKPFIGGLNTEASDTDDMVLNTSDELNCTILPEQMRGRRYGFNIEKDGKWIDSGKEIVAHSLYHWNNVYENVNYIVVQINDKLYIYPDTKPHSQQNYLAVIDLSQYATLAVIEPVSMTSVSSSLFVVGRWIKPIVVETVANTLMFNVTINNPKFRDFNGVEDGYSVDYLPTTLTSRHKYNLINQGWDKEIFNPEDNTHKTLLPDGLGYNGLFYEDYKATYGSGVTGCYPANNMQWFLGKQNSGKYNTTDLLNTYYGNTPAPKGHFIIDYLTRDRSAVSGIELDDEPAETGVNYDITIPVNNSNGSSMYALFLRRLNSQYLEPYVTIPADYKLVYAIPTNATGTLTKFSWGLKDDCTSTTSELGDSAAYIRANVEDLDRTDARIVNDYIFSQPFDMSLVGITGTGTEVNIATQTINPTGKMFSARGWDFTVPNTTSYVRYEIQLTWPNLDRSHKWLKPDLLNETLVINEINYDEGSEESYEGLPSSDLLRGAITDVESFGGRLFYLCGNTILFSQTLSTNNKNYDKCYQDADPTSEEVSDVISTDGGMIQLLSLGRGKALKSFYRGVLVFGDEEVTGVLSNYINLFAADSYDVIKITSAGLTSKYSVVETDSNIFYWSNHGIYMVGIDENNNISSNCISLNTIQNWYNNLSQFARDNCVGYYDYANNRIYWFYPTTNVADKLDGCLVYDLTFNSFMPQYIDSGKVVRDLQGNFAGILNDFNNAITRSGKTYKCSVIGNSVFDTDNSRIGYIQDKYLTDCQESSTVYEIEPTIFLRAGGSRVVANGNTVLANPVKDAGFNRKSAGLFLISDGTNYSFGDFNDREFHDWDVSPYESYLVSRPITLGDTYFNKQTPVMQTLFKRTEEYKLNPLSTTRTFAVSGEMDLTKDGSDWEGTVTIPANAKVISVTSMIHPSWTGTAPDGWYCKLGYTNMGYNDIDNTMSSTLHRPGALEVIGPFDCHVWDFGMIVSDPEQVVSDPTSIKLSYTIFYELIEHIDPTERTFTDTIRLTKRGTGSDAVFTSDEISLPADEDVVSVEFTIEPHWIEDVDPTEGKLPYTDDVILDWNCKGWMSYVDKKTFTMNVPTAELDRFFQKRIPNATIFVSDFHIVARQPESEYFIVPYEDDTSPSYVDLTYVIKTSIRSEDTVTIKGADYTTPSGAIIRMRWGWSVNPLSNRWDMLQNGYRPQKDFLHDDYVESRMHIRGRGKAFQVEIRNDDNKDFRLTGLNIITRSPQ